MRLSRGSVTKGNGSMSILIAASASSAIFSSTAATARIGSPMYAGELVSMAALGASTSGTSSAVRMPITPSIASAAEVSIFVTFPWAIGLVYMRAKTMPSTRKSSAAPPSLQLVRGA